MPAAVLVASRARLSSLSRQAEAEKSHESHIA
jgi:hypothetical protein